LCDPDNRALAVETITTFVRLANDATKADAAALERPEPGQYRRELASDSDAAGDGASADQPELMDSRLPARMRLG
jgi:hypothetical protein